MKKFFRFLISWPFLLNLLGVIVIWILALWGTFSWIKSYGKFDQSVDVPNFIGKHIEDLDLFVQKKSVDYEVFDSVYVKGAEPGTVVSQVPSPTDSSGMPAKPGRKVKLTVVPLVPKEIAMPNLVDKSKFIAVKVLQSLDLRYKEEFEYAPAGKNFVLQQRYKGREIDSGAMIPEDARVTLVISKGKAAAKTSVPDLIGTTVNEAKKKMELLDLELAVKCEDCLSNEEKGQSTIFRQSPEFTEESKISGGSIISAWSSTNPAENLDSRDNETLQGGL